MDGRYLGPAYGEPGSRAAERMECPGSGWSGGSSSTGPRAGGPALDEHLVEPETRWEVIQGARVQASPARAPHADRHFSIDYVLGAHLARDYVGATDLLTRWSPDDDYATDTSVRRAGLNPRTGERFLEEIAFEVAYRQRRRELDTRARLLSERGVRRIFGIFVMDGTVEEWIAQTGTWRQLEYRGFITDPCLSQPLAVSALLDAAAADEAVARALVARQHPVIEEYAEARAATSYRRGEVAAYLGALRTILTQRNLEPDPLQRAAIDACEDPAVLQRWLGRAAMASHTGQIFAGPEE